MSSKNYEFLNELCSHLEGKHSFYLNTSNLQLNGLIHFIFILKERGDSKATK